jgi:hypothetical protein
MGQSSAPHTTPVVAIKVASAPLELFVVFISISPEFSAVSLIRPFLLFISEGCVANIFQDSS